jgi:hypothetical protein
MSKSSELFKAFGFTILSFLVVIFRTTWQPIFTSLVKNAIIALLIFCIAHFVPHHIQPLTNVSYLGWLTILCVYRLITIKYDDNTDEDTEDELDDPELLDETPPYLENEIPDQWPPQPRNILPKNDGKSSTRE